MDDYYVIDAMTKYGGSFVKALGEAARRADQTNLQKIKDTWSNYWAEYEEYARRDAPSRDS